MAIDQLAFSSQDVGTDRSRLLLVDDHPLYRHGLTRLLNGTGRFVVSAEADDALHALNAMRMTQPDAAIVDISLPGTNGLELIKLMLAERPRLPILVVSMHDESLYALRAFRAGAYGYVMKEEAAEQIVDALDRILSGGVFISPRLGEQLVFKVIESGHCDFGAPVEALSDREREVLDLLGHGRSTRQIADALHLSIKTIETHRAHIKEKLRCRDAEELLAFATGWSAEHDK